MSLWVQPQWIGKRVVNDVSAKDHDHPLKLLDWLMTPARRRHLPQVRLGFFKVHEAFHNNDVHAVQRSDVAHWVTVDFDEFSDLPDFDRAETSQIGICGITGRCTKDGLINGPTRTL